MYFGTMKLPVCYSGRFSLSLNIYVTYSFGPKGTTVGISLHDIRQVTCKNEVLCNSTVLQISIDLKISHRLVCFFVSLFYNIRLL